VLLLKLEIIFDAYIYCDRNDKLYRVRR